MKTTIIILLLVFITLPGYCEDYKMKIDEDVSVYFPEAPKGVRFDGDIRLNNKAGITVAFGTYKEGKLEGMAYDYYADGKIHIEALYKKGLRHGELKVYYEDGNIMQTVTYVNGVLDGLGNRYHRNGIQQFELIYKHNEIISGFCIQGNKRTAIERSEIINWNGQGRAPVCN